MSELSRAVQEMGNQTKRASLRSVTWVPFQSPKLNRKILHCLGQWVRKTKTHCNFSVPLYVKTQSAAVIQHRYYRWCVFKTNTNAKTTTENTTHLTLTWVLKVLPLKKTPTEIKYSYIIKN